jgi:PAS domain S-box-containing protein
MASIVWFFALLYPVLAVWFFKLHNRQQRRLQKLQQALQDAKVNLHQVKEEYDHKEANRENTADRLRGYLHLLDTVINTTSTPVYFKNAQGFYEGCNQVFAKQILGLTRDKIIGRRPQDLPEQIPPDLAATYQRQENIMNERGRFHTFEAQVRCADGQQREFLFNLSPLRDDADQPGGCVTVMSDLTEKNRAAQDRLQKEKLQGVLETAGAACHEFNQPLQALSGYIEILTMKTGDDEKLRAIIERIIEQVNRLARITGKLQNITRYETTDYAGNKKIIDIYKASNS